ncbi:DUF7619 domain-containing protein [Flavobacterium sp. XGLA_31]|uniref:DUF7619 domain-containing protein n=1 Tax=Flavobacterium sp. XGLA_31 TaxID=3447666 RepID=UPI003F37AE36
MKTKLPCLFWILFFVSVISVKAQPICGGTFTDPAGANANYANNSDYTVTIFPTNPGEVVTVTFLSFSTESSWDALYIFDGNSINAPQIASNNPAGSVPGGLAGGYWGSTIPEPVTSTSPDGSLTFLFRSDNSFSYSGWVANVTCGTPPTCLKPTLLSTSNITATTTTLGWSESGTASAWEYIVLPVGSPAPTMDVNGYVSANSNPVIVTGLTPLTCYTVYVRAYCSETDRSIWSTGKNFCTTVAPPVCGGQFVDIGGPNGNYVNDADETYTVCPELPGDLVTVSFVSFFTETNWDALYVFDGNSINAPQIASSNPAANVPGGLTGGYWGNLTGTSLPGPFTSSSPDGCLTFRFRSDGSGNYPGWVANVTCDTAPTCIRPSGVQVSSLTLTTATLNWTENNTATSWEVLVLPCNSPNPTAADFGQIVTTNPSTITGLTPGTCYNFYVRSICSAADKSDWSIRASGFTLPSNDECSGALSIPINYNGCNQLVAGSVAGATASEGISSACIGTPDDDVWFNFVASSPILAVSLQEVTGSTNNLNFIVYSGTCDNLTQVTCSSANSLSVTLSNLTIGQTYYLRVYSNQATAQTVSFSVCITTPSTCNSAQSICGANSYHNSTNIPNMGTIGCLFTTPNATFFTLRIASSGAVNLNIKQSTIGSSVPNLDVDYAAWGPFASQSDACNYIGSSQPYATPEIGGIQNQTTGCSYSASPTENLNITNALEGEYYILLVTNYSNQPGIINVLQSNIGEVGAGSIDCSGIRLNAFLDINGNGVQDSGEMNFPLGQFHYTLNNSSEIHNITSPSGTYVIYDNLLTNSYNFSYAINSEYNNMYSTSVSYTNITPTSGGMMTTYNFPITVLQNFNDVGISMIPLSAPRAGFTYKNKIIYFNSGNQSVASGTLTFNNANGTTITNISQTGTTTVSNGFTYSFTNLLPFETRSIVVTLSVPPIPTVAIGQLLTNTASITSASDDAVSGNNSSSSVQAVIASYDPNDKIESHGEKILFSSFTANDYLEYTIRFENTGNSPALDVVVNDLLDNRLDESTVTMIDASHDYILDRVSNALQWKFKDIMLPVSIANTDVGKGYIKFKIRPKPGYAVGDIIPNFADIYFDSNPAITTNTFNTEFVEALGTATFNTNAIDLYPNPAHSSVMITNHGNNEKIVSLVIYDVSGKRIYTHPHNIVNEITIDVSHFAKGMYLIELTSESNSRVIKKLVVK